MVCQNGDKWKCVRASWQKELTRENEGHKYQPKKSEVSLGQGFPSLTAINSS